MNTNSFSLWRGFLLAGAMLSGILFASSAFAADTITSIGYYDLDGNGTVDHLRLLWDESIDQCTFEAGDWTIDTAGTINLASIDGIALDAASDGKGDCNGTDGYVWLEVTADANVTGGATDPQITYTNQGTTGSLSGVTTAEISTIASTSVSDYAAAVFVSTSPSDSATSVSRTTDVSITFSEPMDTGFAEGTEFTVSPDPGGFSAAWTVGDTVVTLTLPTLACGVTYSMTTAEGEIFDAGDNLPAITTGPVDGDFSFTTTPTGCSSGSSGASSVDPEPESYEIDLASISDMDAGDFYTLSWDSSKNFSFVDFFYKADGGEYVQFADNIINDGAHKWRVPDFDENMQIKIAATDLVSEIATDVESVTGDVEEDDSMIEEPAEDDTTEEEDVSDEAAPAWDVEGVEPGDLVRGETLSTVYYITDTYERRPFINEQAFFTWYDDFDSVETIADEDLAAFDLGGLMLPQAGTVLVKIESDARVYALSEGDDMYSPFLHAIDSEEDAQELWGSDWADYVIDIPSTFFTRFGTGDIVNPDYFEVDMDMMKKREDLR